LSGSEGGTELDGLSLAGECGGEQHQNAKAGGGQLTHRQLTALLGVVLFALSFFVYCRTLQPSVGDFGDSAKFQIVAHALGIPHATGYPLYVPLAKLFTLLPLRDVAFRVNLFSGVSAALAVASVGIVIWALTRDLVASAGGALLFAWSKTFWSQAIIAEVYALNALFLILVILFLFRWRARGGTWLRIGALTVYALSLGNHASMVLLIPALLWFAGVADRRVLSLPRDSALAVGILVLGVCPYLLLFLRATQHPAYCETCPDTLPKLWWYVTGAQFRLSFFAFSWQEFVGRVVGYGNFLVAEYGMVPVAVGLLGIVALGASGWRELGFLGLAFVFNVLFTMSYGIVDFMFFLIPSYLVFAIWIGSGFAAVARWGLPILKRLVRPVHRWVVSGAWSLAVAGVAMWPLWANYAILDESNDYAAREEAEAVLNLMAEDAILVLPPCCDFYNRAMAVLYLQQVEGVRSDVLIAEFDSKDPKKIARPSFLPQGERMPELCADSRRGVRAAFFPHVSPGLRETLEDHFVLSPVDLSTTAVADLLEGLPDDSIVIIASRHPISFSVDEDAAQNSVGAAMQGLGFSEVHWPASGAHALIGVRGAEPGTAVEVWDEWFVQVQLRVGQLVGTTGAEAPVPIQVLASTADTDIVVAGRNASPHHRGYNLVALEPDSGEVMVSAHFDTEAFLINNVRVYRMVAIK
jgi:hypothetical protein